MSKKALPSFDKSLAVVSLPAMARTPAGALHNYTKYADKLEAARLKAATQGEQDWRGDVAAEKAAGTDPTITALTQAGFEDSCQAR